MKELSLNILDIAENSVKAKATLTEISIIETSDILKITITDNGCGMSDEILKTVSDPFYTTRTTRKVGLGIPLLKLEAEQTGGYVEISSRFKENFPDNHGTVITSIFYKNHIDFTPLGDVPATIITLIQGHPHIDFLFKHSIAEKEISLDTRQLREILDGVPLDSYEIIKWIEEYMREQYTES